MTRTAIGKRVEALELQARADKWAVYHAWLAGLPAFVMPEFDSENAVEIDAALALRFPELASTKSHEESEHESHTRALDAALDAGMTQEQAMRQFDPPSPPSIAARLECQHLAAITAGVLSSENLTADERAFLVAVQASQEWAGKLAKVAA